MSRSTISTNETGASIEVFYSDRTLETFGKCGAGWFYWTRRRGFSPEGTATGPFATSYSAYRQAMNTAAPISRDAGAPSEMPSAHGMVIGQRR